MDDGDPGAAVPESRAGQARSSATSPGKDGPTSVEGVLSSSSPIIDLSRSGLQHLGELFKIPTLQQLHLQRNALRCVPTDFFQLLPHLTWLDLRHNQIEALPPGVGAHRYLKTLLLERNPIKVLPAELGNVSTLKALNLRHCPLEFPPPPVVQRGLAAVLSFLRAAERSLPRDPATRANSSASKTTLRSGPHPAMGLPGARVLHREAARPQAPEGPPLKGQAGSLAPLEKLDPSDVRRSTGSSEDWPHEEELRRFWNLRQEIVEKEQAETLAHQLLALRLPPNLRAVLCNPEPRRGPREDQTPRRKLPSCGGALPGLARPLEESQATASRELRVRVAQRTRDGRALQVWKEHAQAMRTQREALGTALPPRRAPATPHVPFAADLAAAEKTAMPPPGKRRQSREKSLQASEEPSAARAGDLAEKPKQHVRPAHARSKRLREAAPLGDTRTETQDPETARKLQDEVMTLRSGSTLNGSPHLPALPGDPPPCPPASQSQNVFFNTKR